MKKRMISFFLCCLSSTLIFGQEYHEYSTEIVSSYPKGYEEYELGFGGDRSGSIAGFINFENNLIGVDQGKEKIVVFQEDGSISHISLVDESKIYISGPLGSFQEHALYGIEESFLFYENFENQIYYEAVFYGQYIDSYEVIPFDHIIFAWRSRSGEIVSIVDPGTDEATNRSNFLNTEATRALFEEESEILPEGLILDDQDRLFLNGELLTRDYEQFYQYWKSYWKDRTTEIYAIMEAHEFFVVKSEVRTFIGIDNDRNWYWGDGKNIIAVFNNEGIQIDWFTFPEDNSEILPAVSPEGDIYTMSFDDNNAYLWKIPRQW